MENKNSTSKSLMLNYGLILGFISILTSALLYATGNSYNINLLIVSGIVMIIITIVLITFGIKKFKQINNGLLSLSEAIKVGLGIALISGLLSVAYNFTFNTFIEPDYEKNMITATEEWTINTFSLPEEAAIQLQDANIEEIENYEAKPLKALITGLSSSLIFGLIISLIAGLIMKRTEEDNE